MPFGKFFVLALSLVFSLPLMAAKIQLSPQIVVDRVLGESYEAKKIELDTQNSMLVREKALSDYDFAIKGAMSYEHKEGETLTGLTNPQDKTYNLNLGIEKPTRFGTTFGFKFDHFEQSSILNPIVAGQRTPTAAMDVFGLSLRQNLLYDYFGSSGRKKLQSADLEVSVAELVRQENLENLMLDSMVLYWRAYVSQVNLRDSMTARDKYSELLKTVKNKGRFGIEKKGELPQVEAEMRAAESKVKLDSLVYLRNIDLLLRMLKMESSEDVDFLTTNEIPPLPKLAAKEYKNLRPYRINAAKKESADLLLSSLKGQGLPDLDFVAKGETVGMESSHSASFGEAVAGKKPNYYVGLELRTSIDSSGSRAALAEKRIQAELASNAISRNEMDLRSQSVLTEEVVKANYAVAKNGLLEVEFREKTVRDQEVGYRQGRVPLNELIQSFEKLFKAQTEKSVGIGEYHMSLNSLAAFRDELVEEKKHEN